MANNVMKCNTTNKHWYTQPDPAASDSIEHGKKNNKIEEQMKTTYKYIKLVLLSGLLLMALANRAKAITVDSETLLSTLNVGVNDDITVINGAKLWIDNVNASTFEFRNLTIGSGAASGSVEFYPNATITLTINGNVNWGGSAANTLIMAGGSAVSTLKVKGSFLSGVDGNGTFSPGVGTVEYYNTGAQTVQPLQYKNLTLSGSGNKTVTGVTVLGNLVIKDAAVPAGTGSIVYGSLATLQYASTTTGQTTTSRELPTGMTKPVTFNNTFTDGVTLDGDKVLSGLVTVNAGAALKDGGKTLTLTGNLVNNGTHSGTGKIVLGATTPQTVTAGVNAKFGNVQVNNTAPLTVGGNPQIPVTMNGTITVNGRLTLTNGKVKFPAGTSTITLLTIGTTDKAAGIYSAATDVNYFDASGGSVTVGAKPGSALGSLSANPTITYGDASATFTGKVVGAAASSLANGIVPLNGETVTVTLTDATVNPNRVVTQNATVFGNDGSYAVTFATGTFPVATHVVSVSYAGGINLGPVTSASAQSLIVTPKTITVQPTSLTKIYGQADQSPLFDLTTVSGFVNGDTFAAGSAVGRTGTEDVGSYLLNEGNLRTAGFGLSGNYTLNFISGATFTILKKTIIVVPSNATKVYDYDMNNKGGVGTSYDTAAFNAALVSGDSASGNLSRDKAGTTAGEAVGSYQINNNGSDPLKAGRGGATPNYNNYTIIMDTTPKYFTITARPIVITADAQSKVYGEGDPALTYTKSAELTGVAGVSDGTSWAGSLQRDGGEDVTANGYTINNNRGAGDRVRITGDNAGNYALSFVSKQLTITKRPVTIKAIDNAGHTIPSKTYGDNNPELVDYANLAYSVLPHTGSSGNDRRKPSTSPSVTTSATASSVPGSYSFTVPNTFSDPNYEITYGTPMTATLTVNKKTLTVKANNVTKIANASPFGIGNFTVDWANAGFVTGDNQANSLTGILTFSGPAVTAVDVGVYTGANGMMPTGLASTKYTLNYVGGTLTITGSIGTTAAQNTTWTAGGSLIFQINKANGTAGADPGWSLLNVVGPIVVPASGTFTISLTTQTPGSAASGQMANFDPTRPYSWKFATASGGISGFDVNRFAILKDGAGLFMNNYYGGAFSVSNVGNDLFINFEPNAAPNVAELLPGVLALGKDTLSMVAEGFAGAATITPQQSITINLNVANLSKPVVGAQAFIQFDSRFFSAAASGATAPVVAAGDTVWTEVISKIWRINNAHDGDLDMVIGVKLGGAVAGTTANGTVAKITLTPTATATGKSRVVFRRDLDPTASEPTATTTLTASDNTLILPMRVMTDDIIIAIDANAPDITTITATQTQPHVGLKDVLKRRDSTDNANGVTTVRGRVNISVSASDSGVGLNGKPTLVLAGPNGQSVPLNTDSTTSPFQYSWDVQVPSAGSPSVNGTWTATVTASDKSTYRVNADGSTSGGNGNKTTTFTMLVNVRQLTGVVQLEGFKGASRLVTFKTADGNGGSADIKSWPITLNFTSGALVSVGAFDNLTDMAAALKTPTDAVSTYLKYGELRNISTIVDKLLNDGGISGKIRTQLFGKIDASDLGAIANLLLPPSGQQSALMYYIYGSLSAGTKVAMAQYQLAVANHAANNSVAGPSAAQISALTWGLLVDLNAIVAGPSIYQPLRFASVAGLNSVTVNNAVNRINNGTITNDELDTFNRYLLETAFTVNSAKTYYAGTLHPDTATALVAYPNAGSENIVASLLQDLYTYSLAGSLIYNDQDFLGIALSGKTQSDYLAAATGTPTAETIANVNMELLGDAYAASFTAPRFARETVVALNNYNAADSATVTALNNRLVTDLNIVINGSSILASPRFDAYSPGFTGELLTLSQAASLTSDQKVRLNRLLLEFVYNTQLAKGTLAAFTLTDVPSGALQVSAKTAWNLRATQAVAGAQINGAGIYAATVNFVSDGVPGWTGADMYLRAGDMNDSNSINVFDYNVLRANWRTNAGGPADVNGDGAVNSISGDYELMKSNWLKSGDNEVQ